MANTIATPPEMLNDTGIPDPTYSLVGGKLIGEIAPAPASPDAAGAVLILLGVAASVLVHLLLVLWAVGSFAWPQSAAPDEAIPITVVQEENVPPPPPPQAAERDQTAPVQPEPEGRDAASLANAVEIGRPDGQGSGGEGQSAVWSHAIETLGLVPETDPLSLTEDELKALRGQAERCWEIPAGWTEPRQVSVTIRFRLSRDGTLDGAPRVVQFPASELGKASAANALRAIEQCGPFDLPPEKYAQWRDIQLRLEP